MGQDGRVVKLAIVALALVACGGVVAPAGDGDAGRSCPRGALFVTDDVPDPSPMGCSVVSIDPADADSSGRVAWCCD